MTIIQSIIASAVGQGVPPGPNWFYPPSGNSYPVAYGAPVSAASGGAVSGYYEEGSLSGPQLGMWRRTFQQEGLTSEFAFVVPFPTVTASQEMADASVGFGYDVDVNTNFTISLTGYFKPAQTGDYVFSIDADDYAAMWIGAPSWINTGSGNAIIKANNSKVDSLAYTLTAGKYYPVRILYTEVSGGHKFTIWSGLNNTVLQHQADSASTGQFYFDGNSSNAPYLGEYPSTGMIT